MKTMLLVSMFQSAAKLLPTVESMDHKEKAPDLRNYVGLHWVDFYVIPHIGNWKMRKAAENIVAKYPDSLELCVSTTGKPYLSRVDMPKF